MIRCALLLLAALAIGGRVAAFSPPSWATHQPIYEVNLAMYSQKGTYRALEKRLPELKALGVGILWLMPIMTRGSLHAFGSPYCVRDYRGLYAPYGSASDLKSLVAAIHRQGMHVILDWVGNHSSWDNPLIVQHPEFYVHDKQGKIIQAHEWADVAQLNYKNPALRAWMIEAMKYWVKTYDVDGFRCDVAWGIPIDFWVEARKQLETIKPVFMLAEAGDPTDQQAFDADYNFDLMNSAKENRMIDIAHGLKPASLIGKLQRLQEIRYAPHFNRMNFTSNHDEWDNGTPFQRFGPAVHAMAVLAATLPGRPMIYNGQEIGWDASKGPISWSPNPRSESFRAFYTCLFQAYQSHPALYQGDWREIATDHPDEIVAFVRHSGDDKILVFLNLSDKDIVWTAKDPELGGDYQDLFKAKSMHLGAAFRGSFSPWEYQVFLGHGVAKRGDLWDRDALTPKAIAGYDRASSVWHPVTGWALGVTQGVQAGFDVTWNSSTLDVDVCVTKTPLVRAEDLGNPWNADSVEVYFDMKHDRSASYQSYDFQYIVGYEDPQLFESSGRIRGVKFTHHVIQGGYEVELAIPWETLGVHPYSGACYGFDVGVNLGSRDGKRGGALIWSGDDQNYRDTGLFGDLFLANARL